MKKLTVVLAFLVLALASCKKDCITPGQLVIANISDVPLNLYFDESRIVYPGESVTLQFTTFQMNVPYRFEGQGNKSITVQVPNCDVVHIGLSD